MRVTHDLLQQQPVSVTLVTSDYSLIRKVERAHQRFHISRLAASESHQISLLAHNNKVILFSVQFVFSMLAVVVILGLQFAGKFICGSGHYCAQRGKFAGENSGELPKMQRASVIHYHDYRTVSWCRYRAV